MDMICHQAICPYFDFVLGTPKAHTPQIMNVIIILEKKSEGVGSHAE
jgi:hypothetical protein